MCWFTLKQRTNITAGYGCFGAGRGEAGMGSYVVCFFFIRLGSYLSLRQSVMDRMNSVTISRLAQERYSLLLLKLLRQGLRRNETVNKHGVLNASEIVIGGSCYFLLFPSLSLFGAQSSKQ